MATRWSVALVVTACLISGGVAKAQVRALAVQRHGHRYGGGVLVGATVIATNVETNVESKATTTDAGVYVIPYLANGLYRIRVEAVGFRPAQAEEVTLRAAQTLTLDFKLDVDALTEVVSVTAPVIETSTAEIGHYVSNKEFQTWPIPSATGSGRSSSSSFRACPGTTGGTFEGSINGGRNYSHEILIEGIPLGRNLQGGSNNEMSPPTEAVEEFKLQTGTLGADSAAARRLSRTSSSSPAPTSSTARARSTCRTRVGRAAVRRQGAQPGHARSRAAELGGRARRADRPAGCTTAATAASSSRRSRRRASESRRRPPSARCRRASSRTATSRVSSIRLHRRCPLRHGRRHGRARAAGALRPDLRPALDARRRRPGDARSVPEQPDPARAVGCGGAQHTRAGALGRAGAGSTAQQPADARHLLPGVRPEHVRGKFDQVLNNAHKMSFYVNREWRTRNNSPPAATARRLVGRPTCISCRTRRAG